MAAADRFRSVQVLCFSIMEVGRTGFYQYRSGFRCVANIRRGLAAGVLTCLAILISYAVDPVDVLAFLIILIAAKKPRYPRYPGIPNLLDAILRDATIYFVLMFLCQVLFDVFVAFVSVSHPR